jgi:xylulokinase
MAASGSALNWLAAIVGRAGEGERPHKLLDRLAADVAPGSDGVLCLPYFLGEKTPIQDPLARGTFTGLSLGHGPAHLWRALLEAVAYGFRHHADVLAEIGYRPKRFLASDGGTQSAVWMQIVADVLQADVQVLENPHGSCVGAAWVAAVGSSSGVAWGDVARMARLGPVIRPDRANGDTYTRGYRAYRALYEALKPVFHMRAE